MAALPSSIHIPCPACGTPVELPLTAGPHKVVDDRLVVNLGLDTAPMTAHWSAEHLNRPADEQRSAPGQAEVTTHANVVLNVTRASPDDGALGRQLEEQTRRYPFGDRRR